MYNLLEVLLILTALNQRWAFYGLSSSENFAFYKTFDSVGFKFLLFPGIAFLFNGTFKKIVLWIIFWGKVWEDVCSV